MIERSNDSAEPAPFEIAKRQVDGAMVLSVSGEVDMLSAPQLDEAIRSALADGPAALIVDLTKVDFLASAGMTILVTAQAEVAPPTRFAVVANGPATSRPIKLTGLDGVLSMYSTLDTALSRVTKG
ncbi:anti-anti-sigma factor [Mycobacterium alsense]|uniref:Anti-sigma factor antagonist n=1 Tax=Mycobacterium alsense TaxID=324058 RepID=A0AA42BXD9_9MYCO|nr:STAS domain-containing protein [Mycobacterium alsense]MCV7378056.1 STAS domain-containing protein [Mycobacterium alsense]OQZ93459.1 anti-anti-sigma factor [Mycobacterium alsense]